MRRTPSVARILEVSPPVPLDPRDVDLALVALESQPDAILVQLASFAQAGIGYPVTVIVHGIMLSGNLASGASFGSYLDSTMLSSIETALNHRPSDSLTDLRSLLEGEGSLRKLYDDLDEERKRVDQELAKLGEEDPDPELDRAALEASAIRFLNLEDAYVFPPNSPPFELEMVRVRLSHVGAWWPGKASPP